MKVAEKQNDVQISGEIIEEHKCSISDMAFAMELLTKHYTEPIKAICQEIMSNARDAHREIGKDDVPISVTLPTALDPRWVCRDYGIGISPERIKDVFVRYGASTKRDDNIQTGGFGIGAKTPWAYSSTFGIETYYPENEWTDSDGETHYNVMIKRVYMAYIGKDRIGRLSQTVEEITDEPRGTKIIVTAKEDDFQAFIRHTLRSGIFWDIKPDIKGIDNFVWPDLDIISGNDDYILLNSNDHQYSSHKLYNEINDILSKQWIIVDGIPYPFEMQYLKDKNKYYSNEIKLSDGTNLDYYRIYKSKFLLFFEVGDLVVSTNREQINYDETDLNVIRKKFTDAVNDLRTELQNKISKIDNYWDALSFYSSTDMFGTLNINPIWNGIKLYPYLSISDLAWKNRAQEKYGQSYSIRCREYTSHEKTKNDETIDIIKYKECQTIKPSSKDKYIFVVQDNYGDPLEQKIIWTILKDNKNRTVIVLDPGSEKQYKIINESIHYDLLNPIKYSTISPTPIPKFSRKKTTSNGKIKKVFSQNYMRECPVYYKGSSKIADFVTINLQDDKGVYVIDYRSKEYIKESDIEIKKSLHMRDIVERFGVKVYAIKRADLDKLGKGWVSLHDLLIHRKKHEANKLKKLNYVYYENFNMEYSIRYNYGEVYDTICRFMRLSEKQKHDVLNKLSSKNIMYKIFDFVYNEKKDSEKKQKGKNIISNLIFIGKLLGENWFNDEKRKKEKLESYNVVFKDGKQLLHEIINHYAKKDIIEQVVSRAKSID